MDYPILIDLYIVPVTTRYVCWPSCLMSLMDEAL